MQSVARYTIEQLLLNNLSGLSFCPRERSILFTSDASGVRNVFSIPISGDEPIQLTHSSDDSLQSISYFPNDSRVMYLRDKGNSENALLCVREKDGKETVLTPAERIQARFAGWSGNGDSFYCAINSRDERFLDFYRINATSYERSLLFENTSGYVLSNISRDDKYASFLKINSRSDSDLYLYNLGTGRTKHLTPHVGDVFFSCALFDCQGRLYYLTDKDNEFSYVVRHDLDTGKIECFHKESGEILQIRFSHTCRYLIVLVNENNRKIIKVYDQHRGRRVNLPAFPEAIISQALISKSERLMACYVNGDRTPNTLHVYSFATGQSRKLVGGLDHLAVRRNLAKAKAISFKSFDGLDIPCLLWKQQNGNERTKSPAMVWVHGGPGGQMTWKYSARIQYLVNHGYVILGVNYRGSSGYGKTFLAADSGKHGREPLWDCIEAKKYLQSLDYVDSSRIGIIGSSLGGYMVLAAMAFHPDEFAVGVDICGVSNWLNMLKALPPYWAAGSGNALYEKLGDPATDQDRLLAISPIFSAHRIVKPLLVIQGANDQRVKKSESDAIFEAIRGRKGLVEYLVLDSEAHVIRKRANAILAYETILNFLERHLKQHTA